MNAAKIAYKMLAMRGLFSDELEKKLLQKGCDPEEIGGVLEELKVLGYLDDAREFDLFMERRLAKGEGPHLIASKLRERTTYGNVQIGEDVEREMIKCWVEKKAGDAKEKVYRFLVRKGFDSCLVRGVLLD